MVADPYEEIGRLFNSATEYGAETALERARLATEESKRILEQMRANQRESFRLRDEALAAAEKARASQGRGEPA